MVFFVFIHLVFISLSESLTLCLLSVIRFGKFIAVTSPNFFSMSFSSSFFLRCQKYIFDYLMLLYYNNYFNFLYFCGLVWMISNVLYSSLLIFCCIQYVLKGIQWIFYFRYLFPCFRISILVFFYSFKISSEISHIFIIFIIFCRFLYKFISSFYVLILWFQHLSYLFLLTDFSLGYWIFTYLVSFYWSWNCGERKGWIGLWSCEAGSCLGCETVRWWQYTSMRPSMI